MELKEILDYAMRKGIEKCICYKTNRKYILLLVIKFCYCFIVFYDLIKISLDTFNLCILPKFVYFAYFHIHHTDPRRSLHQMNYYILKTLFFSLFIFNYTIFEF